MMYHYVYTKEDVPENINTNYLLDTDLEDQLAYLTSQNYYFPSYKELYAYIKGEIDLPEKSIILTFDDGQKGFFGVWNSIVGEISSTCYILYNCF